MVQLMRRAGLVAIFLVQLLCALFFISDIVLSMLGLVVLPMSWGLHEFLEISAVFSLLIGLWMAMLALLRLQRDHRAAHERLRRASGAFMTLLAERFAEWGLTPAERDVALFAIKGLSTAEIATMRTTSEGTVKAQTNAIYRKAGVNGRGQLLSLFIEDLMADAHLPAKDPALIEEPMPEPEAVPRT
ncbi:helix-turn-helix transcriptional regulator [Phaeovulum sp.]|uniref:helix-turn-helix transcriptional regulator n=1 Tax=Phaeovulum sp. TaxID=2934796 RepID=UPI002AB80923|nr:LuxR C-terminal-related transcriptional regulator [Phaeovulum sp.]MDZ4119310.1 LuxR C-terminal-related transcriptional regulator [Phaeovulum sp.]